MAAVIIDPNLLRDGNGTRRNIEANYEQQNLNGNASIMNPIFLWLDCHPPFSCHEPMGKNKENTFQQQNNNLSLKSGFA